MRGKLGAKKWQWRLLSLNEETLAWYSEASAGGGADGTAEDAMTEMVRPAPAPAPALPLHVTLRCVALSTINWPIQSVNVNTHAHNNKLVRLFCGDANVCYAQAGSIAIKDIAKVWASAGKAKGRGDELCMQIEGEALSHSYTLAAPNRQERDAWVVALRTMAAAHSIILQTE